jgi:hypothetical protein
MLKILLIVLLATSAPKIQAQQHQARNWYCIRQHFAETTEGGATPRGSLHAASIQRVGAGAKGDPIQVLLRSEVKNEGGS